MMNKRTTKLIVLVLIVALLVLACFLLSGLNKEEETSETEDESITLCDFSDKEITNIAYTYNGTELSFTSDNGQWKYDADGEFPVTQNTVTSMIESISTVMATRKLDGAEDASVYGFDSPMLIATVTADGSNYSFEVGDLNSYSGTYYLRYNEELYMTDETLVTVFSKNLYDYLTTTDLPDLENIISFTVDGKEITDETVVADLTESYDQLIRGNVADYRSKESYGFDGNQHTVVVTYTVDNDVTDDSGNVISTVTTDYTYSFEYAYVEDNAYIMLQDDDLIYEVSGTSSFDIIETAD